MANENAQNEIPAEADTEEKVGLPLPTADEMGVGYWIKRTGLDRKGRRLIQTGDGESQFTIAKVSAINWSEYCQRDRDLTASRFAMVAELYDALRNATERLMQLGEPVVDEQRVLAEFVTPKALDGMDRVED